MKDFEDLKKHLDKQMRADAQADIRLAKKMMDDALANIDKMRSELGAVSEERRIAHLAKEILEWGDEGGIAVVAAVAIMRLGGFK